MMNKEKEKILELKIIKISNGEKAQELSYRMVKLINEYSEFLTGFEMIGVIDAIRMDIHEALRDDEEIYV